MVDVLINPLNAAAGDEVREWYDEQTARWGYLPNYAAAFASRPEVARAWTALNGAVRDGMDRRRFEIATIAAARALRSTYCTTAHSKFLRDACNDETTMLAIAADPEGGSLDPADKAVMAFARKVALDAASISQGDVDALHAVGLSDNDIADIVFAAAARSFFAKVLDGVGVSADHQLGETFDPDVTERLTVGRPIASAPKS
ncbi:MAG TPA: carboxymuconolactone decarboxylase family protein [Ilumatobacteraceae bacterium]|nr:carboxymuconolactone decarboxylase family protein [Ilumatobacteraceae bacterium]